MRTINNLTIGLPVHAMSSVCSINTELKTKNTTFSVLWEQEALVFIFITSEYLFIYFNLQYVVTDSFFFKFITSSNI